MTSLNFDYRRPCYVNGKKAMFHCWSHISRVVTPSLMFGGDNGGVVSDTYGIVEFEDGTINRTPPEYIRFADGGDFSAIAFLTESTLNALNDKNQSQN